jgi:tetratricopeptide (TPR) repeat protein
MLDIKSMMAAKQKAAGAHEQYKEKYENIYNEAFELFNRYLLTEDLPVLQQSAEKFAELVKVKSTRIEPYFFLGLIFYILGKDEDAITYLKYAREIDPEYQEVNSLLELILKGEKNA